ncbi:salicylate hydroxylase [Polyplosphaeria fusca]|uniref:Salicylate hydroxylase n=1 Tax=Polyplosphaeria fusca TaxID=682080 RepID=A0A9P4QZW8_9PLEO|nr:salicylate hydroxylase [Polyplosphaeria fusca]
MASTEKIRIAIIGGGLAGATLINALLKLPHLQVNIFESAPEFSERGAAVGLSINAQTALAEIGGDIVGAPDKAGAVQMLSSRLLVACGPDAGEVIFDLGAEKQGKQVHRAALLAEILKPVPKEQAHTSKKLLNIEEGAGGSLTLHFKDGTTFQTDAVIGADGIHGYVRSYVLGADHPALKPTFAGFWDCGSVVSVEKARTALGERWLRDGEERQYGWLGDGGFFMYGMLDGGKNVQCVASALTDEEWSEDEWKRGIGREKLEEIFGGWTNAPIKEGIIDILVSNPDLRAFSQWHFSKDAPTFSKDRVCMMGDAAHALTPWQGAGAGQAIEDAMVLQTVLGKIKTSSELEAAFRAFDEVRRPRAQRIRASSREAGITMCGRGENGMNVEKVREELKSKWDFIFDQDQKEQNDNAVKALLNSLGKDS